jgi:hypothetical protein
MFGTGDQVSDLPVEAVVGDGFFETEGTDLGGARREATELLDLWCQQRTIDRGAVRSRACWKSGLEASVMKRGKTGKMTREGVQPM